jgi:hypothetical protein
MSDRGLSALNSRCHFQQRSHPTPPPASTNHDLLTMRLVLLGITYHRCLRNSVLSLAVMMPESMTRVTAAPIMETYLLARTILAFVFTVAEAETNTVSCSCTPMVSLTTNLHPY